MIAVTMISSPSAKTCSPTCSGCRGHGRPQWRHHFPGFQQEGDRLIDERFEDAAALSRRRMKVPLALIVDEGRVSVFVETNNDVVQCPLLSLAGTRPHQREQLVAQAFADVAI